MSGMTCCLGKAQPHSPELLLGWVLPWERDGGLQQGWHLGGWKAAGICLHPTMSINPSSGCSHTARPEHGPGRQAVPLSPSSWIRVREQQNASKLEESLGQQN